MRSLNRFSSAVALSLLVSIASNLSATNPPATNPPTTKPTVNNPPAPSAPAEKKERRRMPLSGFEIQAPAPGTGTRVTESASRGGVDDPVVLLAPGRGKLLGELPLFEWDPKGEEGPYVLEIQDDNAAVVIRETVARPAYVPPGGKDAFEPGRWYTWRVSLSSPSGRIYSGHAYFEVASEGERAEIAKLRGEREEDDSYDAALGRARRYRDGGYWYDAIGAYTAIVNRFPDRAEAYDERGQIYFQIEATKPLAERDFATADGLRGAR